MSLDDLDLEFEDEEDAKNKKKETVDFDVDLEFHTPGSLRPRPEPVRTTQPLSKPSTPEPQAMPSDVQAQVRQIDDARQTQPQPQSQINRGPTAVVKPLVEGTSAIKREVSPENTNSQISLQEQMTKIQIESQVKVSVAEFKTEFLSDILSDMKLMDHQVGQLLARIHAKYPDTKNEVLMIKKIMADFVAKKRK